MMTLLSHVWDVLNSPVSTAILTALLAVSEALAFNPKIKANGIFQAIYNGLKSLKEKMNKPPTLPLP